MVDEAVTGEEAIAFVDDNDIDLALMDCDIPGMGGVEATRRLRATDERLPVVGLVWYCGMTTRRDGACPKRARLPASPRT